MNDFKMKNLKQKQSLIFDQMKSNLRKREQLGFVDRNQFEKFSWNNKMQRK